MYIMVYKSSNYKQWPGIVFWYSQIQNPVQTKIKTLKYFNYIILSSTDIFFFCNFLIIYVLLISIESKLTWHASAIIILFMLSLQ